MLELAHELARDARQARLQRSLALIAGLTSGASGIEVGYMHYRASYGHGVMWTPIVMSQALQAAGIWAALDPRAARTVLPAVSWVALADCAAGAFFHWRGTARKPGGWRLPIPNVPMGPPPMAPLLFGLSAYMGIVASKMKPELALMPEGQREPGATPPEGRLQRHVAAIAGLSGLGSAVEALYSHYKNGFHYAAQWTPVAIGPVLAGAAFAASRATPAHRPRRFLALISLLAMLDAAAGSLYHVRGVLRRPGGSRRLLYNVLYGPPVLAPGLFAASGLLGLLASAMQRG